jgi:hypothetical protein
VKTVASQTRIARLLFALALTVYLFTAGGSLTSTDPVVTFDVTRSIVEHRSVAMSGNLLGKEEERGADGRYYSPFGVGQSVYNIPFYLAAKAADAAGIRVGKPDSLAKAIVALGTTILVAGIVSESFLLAVALTGSVPAALLASLTLAFASILWPYSKFGFNQPLACLLLTAATRQVVTGARGGSRARIAFGGVLIAAGLMTRHEIALASIPLAVWLWFEGALPLGGRVRRFGAFAPGVIGGAVVWGTFNFIRFGHPLISGQDPVTGFGSPIGPGLLGLLLSPGTSVFLYSPVALVGLIGLCRMMRIERSAALLCLATIVLFVGFYATLGNWIGGRSYGSRYLVVMLPFFGVGWAAWLAELTAGARRRAWAIVTGVGLVVQVPGLLVDYAKVSQAAGESRPAFTIAERQWRWEAASLVMNTRAMMRAVPENVDYVTGRRPVPARQTSAAEGDQSFSQQFRFSLDFWWLYLHYMNVLPRVAVLLLTAMFAAAIVYWGKRLACL